MKRCVFLHMLCLLLAVSVFPVAVRAAGISGGDDVPVADSVRKAIPLDEAGRPKCLPIREIPASELAFRGGEKLVYMFSYKWGAINTDVGTAEVILREFSHNGRKAFHGVAQGKTMPFFDLFFKVRDLFESKFYASNVRPYYFARDIDEGGYLITNEYHFNPVTHEITARVKRNSNPVIDTVLPGRECTFDLVSLFYFARNLDFSDMKPGDVRPISFAIDEDIYDLYFRFIGTEVRKVKGIGNVRTLKFAAKLVAGEVFTGKEELFVWVTDDRNKMPVYMESPIIVGSVRAVIKSFENLRFPLECVVRK